jgi:CDP-6-deoxy-D-xylo-4-hexulose-3-dehydrase
MDRVKELHDEILAKVAEYYRLAHAPRNAAPFVPGETRVNYAGRVFDAAEMTNLVDAGLEFWLTSGRYAKEFERGLAAYLGVGHALLVNSGSSANLLAFSALTSPHLGERRIRRGDEVITVACAFPTTVAPIVQYGAVPVFVDVESGTANIDPGALEAARSPSTRAVMVAHTLGNPFDIKAVKAFCDRYQLWLVEDSCDALGSRYDGRPVGTWGDIGTFSFYPPHHLTMGEGGAVCTGDPLLKKILLSIRDWGRDCWCESGRDNSCGCRFTRQFGTLPVGYDHKYVYSHFGYNLKATDLQAAVGCAQLGKLPAFTAKRKANFHRLYEGLKDLPELALFEKYPESDPSWFGFLITLTERATFTRNDLAEHLEKRGIQTRNLFAGNILRHPCFETLREGRDYRVAGPLVNTERYMNDAFWIGVYPGMTEEKLDYMISEIRSFTTAARR